MTDEREYHIGILPGEIPPLVLLPGDPMRAELIANTYFDNPRLIAKNREYWSFKGFYNGTPVAVCSTGIGCPSAAIAIEELIRVGCTTFVRVGTAGAIDPTLVAGDLVVFSGSYRDDGTSKQYVPIEYPAIANPELLVAMKKAAEKREIQFRVGIGHSKDAFYSEFPDKVTQSELTEKKWDHMRHIGVLATEMEAAALFVIGQLRKVRVGVVCTIVGEPIENEAKIVGKPDIGNMIHVALEGITADFSK